MGFSFIRKTASTGSSATGALVAAGSLQPVKTSHILTQLLISWLDIIQVRHFHLELFKKLRIFFLPNQIIRHLPKYMAKAALEVGYLIHL
jgi:hypothetical protein